MESFIFTCIQILIYTEHSVGKQWRPLSDATYVDSPTYKKDSRFISGLKIFLGASSLVGQVVSIVHLSFILRMLPTSPSS